MISSGVIWAVVAGVGFWFALAVFMTTYSQASRSRSPLPFWKSLVARLVVTAPMAPIGVFIMLGHSLGFVGNAIFTLFVVGLTWAAGKKLPVVGQWVEALQKREVRRLEEGKL